MSTKPYTHGITAELVELAAKAMYETPANGNHLKWESLRSSSSSAGRNYLVPARAMLEAIMPVLIAAARGEVAVTAQEAVAWYLGAVEENFVKHVMWGKERPRSWSEAAKPLYTTPPATVPISELRALREKWEKEIANEQRAQEIADDDLDSSEAWCNAKQEDANELAELCAKFGE